MRAEIVAELTDLIIASAGDPRPEPEHTLVVLVRNSGVAEFRVDRVGERYWWVDPDVKDCRSWKFWDLESLHVFMAALMRDYCREGTEVANSFFTSPFRHFYDKRCERSSLDAPDRQLLEW